MYLKVKVFSSAKKESLKEIKEGVFEVKVKEKSENNMANKRVLELLAMHLAVPINMLSIKNGHHRPNKLIEIKNA